MSFAYIRAVIADIGGAVEKALEGLEQSRRWDLLKGVQANIEGLNAEVESIEKSALKQFGEAERIQERLVGELNALKVKLAESNHKYEELLASVLIEAESAPEAAAAVTE